MSETLTNGVIVPDKGSRDWYADLRANWLKLDSLMAGGNITVNPAQTSGILVATITVGNKSYKLYQQDGDVSVKIDPSTANAEYPLVASTSAEANTGSVVMAPAVTVNPSTGAVTATSFKGAFEGTATKANQDGAGAVITDTYATKAEVGAKADDANVVHKTGNETIGGTKTFSSEVQVNSIRAVGDGANITLDSTTGSSGFAIRANNGTTSKELVGYPNGMLAWNNNEILTRVNGVTLDTAQTVTGKKVYEDNVDIRTPGVPRVPTEDTWCRGVDWLDSNNKRIGFIAPFLNPTGAMAIRFFGSNNEGYDRGLFDLIWDANDTVRATVGSGTVLTDATGVTLNTKQTITGTKTFSPWQTFNTGINVKWITGNKEQKALFLFATMNDVYQGYGAELHLHSETLNGGFNLIAKNKTGTNIKFLQGDSNGTLTWGGSNVLTDANQIMVLKNLTGAKITSGAIVDCGTGNGVLVGQFMNTTGAWVLGTTKPTGKWKNVNNFSLLAEESGVFLKVS